MTLLASPEKCRTTVTHGGRERCSDDRTGYRRDLLRLLLLLPITYATRINTNGDDMFRGSAIFSSPRKFVPRD